MYPFNRSDTFRAKNNEENENYAENGICLNENGAIAHRNSEPISNNDKTFMANVLKFSMPDYRWTARFASVTEDKMEFMTMFENIPAATNRMKPALTILRIMGYFCGFHRDERRKTFKRKIIQIFLILISLSVLGFNIHIYRHNVLISLLYNSRFGFLHGATVSHLISGIKPLINAVLVILFMSRIGKHKKMLRILDTVDLCFNINDFVCNRFSLIIKPINIWTIFSSTFRQRPNIKFYMIIFTLNFILSVAIPFFWRVFEVHILGGSFKDELLSFLIVALLTAWNVLPLMYYVLCNSFARFWCRVLRKSLKKEHKERHFSLKFYYEQFLRVTALQEAIGNTFNPFILFSLAWSLILLCLTIYFITQPTSSLTEPITHEQLHNETFRKILNHRFFVNMGWSLIQIIVAILHIIVICATGMRTNEETRKVLNAVLAIVPDANADLDRFQISCFAHKMSTQYMWGMTVWRAFPLERTTFFTLVSVIITYSLLLLKLKENPHISPRCPLLINSTNG